jgi:hypothetical protein
MSETMTKEFNLAGKDWFTEAEAAHYCGVSVRQFAARSTDYGISAKRFMGKKLYERAALHEAISRAPLWCGEARTFAASVDSPLAPYRNLSAQRLRPYKARKTSDASA